MEQPENGTSQDGEDDGDKSKTMPNGNQNASFNPDNHMTSKNQKTEVPENCPWHEDGNTEPTSTQSLNESPSLDPSSESSAKDDTVAVEIHPWVSRDVYKADTQRNYLMVLHVDSQIKSVAEETVHDVSVLSSIWQEDVF